MICSFQLFEKNEVGKSQVWYIYNTRKKTANLWKQNNRFSKNPAERPELLPYNTPLNDTYPGTFIQIPQKVVGIFFETYQNPKIKNLKIPKLENLKIQKCENP